MSDSFFLSGGYKGSPKWVALWEECVPSRFRSRDDENERETRLLECRRVARLCWVARVIAVRLIFSFSCSSSPISFDLIELRLPFLPGDWSGCIVGSGLTYVALVGSDNDAGLLSSFLRHCVETAVGDTELSVVVDGEDGTRVSFKLRFCIPSKPAVAKVRLAKPCAVCVWCTVGRKGESRLCWSWHCDVMLSHVISFLNMN